MTKRLYRCGATLWPRSLQDGHTINLPAGSTFFYDEDQTGDDLIITIDNHDFSIGRGVSGGTVCPQQSVGRLRPFNVLSTLTLAQRTRTGDSGVRRQSEAEFGPRERQMGFASITEIYTGIERH